MDLLLRKLTFISISLILYVASLELPACTYAGKTPATIAGYQSISNGNNAWEFLGESSNPFPFISWLANIPFIIGLIILVFARGGKAFKMSSMTLFVALVMSLCSLALFSGSGKGFTPSIGCFVWIFSMLLMWAGAHLIRREFSDPAAE